MYVCMYVRMYVCMYVDMYVDMYVCMYVCMYVQSNLVRKSLFTTSTFYNNTHGKNGFNGLCTKCPGYNNNLT